MRKKRKGSDTDMCEHLQEESKSNQHTKSTKFISHFSVEDYIRLNKRYKEDASNKPISSCKTRFAGIATAPHCLKRKIGCIDVAIQTNRNKKIEDEYVMGGIIGHGKFGSVWLCKSKVIGVEFACKTLRKGEEIVHREVKVMQHLSGHPRVVTLHVVYEETESANIFKDVMLVTKYYHDMGVVHRDLKPENILLTCSGKIKLRDFGLAMRISNGQNLSDLTGSPAYVAPEVLAGNYSEKVDIWRASVLLHNLLVVLPFQGVSVEAVFQVIKNVKLDFNKGIWEPISNPARDLMSRMLTRDVSVRITAAEVLRHPWILFYTEQTLKTSMKSKSKDHLGATPSLRAIAPIGESHGNKIAGLFLGGHLRPESFSYSLSCEYEEQDECGSVDALAVAISHVKISEPKRSRLCWPTGPIEQQRTSNLTTSYLCRAC
ncbi:hypothetical protein K2173_026766 [Erythroxylum novogranatense]|uniref:Protein kinase domain-containing protein n=1 Tax=Erythroxylum novogranatense TaxID=1862640 RepID=A0AAV8TZW0_9ROSI|nr:hypothetical protein K2173_026766 [Erythroxylum novogranatense]